MSSDEAKQTSEGGKNDGKQYDYGYFGKGSTGYAQYMTAFNRNFGGSSGGGGGNNHNNGGGGDGSGCGCLIAIAVVVVLILIGLGS